MPFRIVSNGHHYNVEVSGAGEPLILLHGFSGDCSTWQEAAVQLGDGFQLVVPDLLGHGASDHPADAKFYRMGAVAADIIDLLNQLSINKAHLAGYSMGGRLALFLALRYRERFKSLVLESASPGLAIEDERAARRKRDEDLAGRIEAYGIEWFVDTWEQLPLWDSQSEQLKAAQRPQRLRNSPRGLANSLRGMGTGAQPNLWSELPDLAVATLLLVGEHDNKFRLINQKMAAMIPRPKLAVIPSAGHNTHLENPQAFYLALRSFLESI